MMSSRYGIFCAVLFVVVLALGFKNYAIWSFPAGSISKREVPKRPDSKPEAFPPGVSQKEIQPREAYKVIGEKNIFHPDRKEFAAVATDQAKPSVRPQITLYGTVVGGDFESATIVNPGRPLQKGEREPKTVKVGDTVGDYKVAKILEDRIVMANGEDSFDVLLYDPGAPKRRIEAKTPTQPVTVTSAGGAPTPTPAPGMPPGSGVPQPMQPISPARRAGAGAPTPQPMSPGATPPSAGPTMQPSGPQTPSSGTIPTPGIFRGRRPMPTGNLPATPGN
jgi:hypothetical protein